MDTADLSCSPSPSWTGNPDSEILIHRLVLGGLRTLQTFPEERSMGDKPAGEAEDFAFHDEALLVSPYP